MVRSWTAQAPSNIALIKYMGKTEVAENRPTNSSLSFTLNHLLSFVQMEESNGGRDTWAPLEDLKKFDVVNAEMSELELSEKGQARFLKHLQFLKDLYKFDGHFVVRSANGFPSDCGLASSASSFAALTKCAVQALSEMTGKTLPSVQETADLSRHGSGSSCRSLFSPWAMWGTNSISAPDLPYQHLSHQVIVVSDTIKKVSSSEAHKQIVTSLLFEGRPGRAEKRMMSLVSALKNQNWTDAFELTWAEFWDMHSLFETAKPSFGYMTEGSLHVLGYIRDEVWAKMGDGPLVTMDAGPNVHFLYRPDQKELSERIHMELSRRFSIYSSLRWGKK